MNPCYHTINNAVKGAGIIRGPQARRQQETITFPQTEINLVNNSLNIARFYITRNPQQFQNPEDMLQKVNQAIEIISTKTAAATKIATKGASNNNDITTTDDKYQSLMNIYNMFGLLNNNNNKSDNQLKGASNNNICLNKKKENLKDILKMFGL